VLVELRPPRGAADDVGQDRRLQPTTLEPAEHVCLRRGIPAGALRGQLVRELRRQGLAARLVALAMANEQGRPGGVEVDVSPLQRSQLGAPHAGGDESEQHEPVALAQPAAARARIRRRRKQPRDTTHRTLNPRRSDVP